MERAAGPVILEELPRATLDLLGTRAARLAVWINIYNDLVTEGIVRLGVAHSVWDVPDFFARIACRIGDAVFSADDIEHGILRGNRPSPLAALPPFPPGDPRLIHAITPLDPRIHFTLNCGARSCPVIRRYEASRLDEQLDSAARDFLAREVTFEGDVLVLSEIFDWFGQDFEECPGGSAAFVAHYLDDGDTQRRLLQRDFAKIAYRPYDWRLAKEKP